MHEMYLKYEVTMPLDVKGYWGDLCPHTFADIMYWTVETEEDLKQRRR